ncbi:MAG: TauD/TfdA family dioxygenase [Planctomycetota bacterium]|nr:TauD/TfdA family dioxygenase [Planctomycetota bacterium]
MSLTTDTGPTSVHDLAECLTVVDGGSAVVAERGDFSRRIPARWLRLMGVDAANMAPATGQRRFRSTTIPPESRVRSVAYQESGGFWEVRFEGETEPLELTFDRITASDSRERIEGPEPTVFSSADQPARALDFDTLDSPAAVRSLLEMVLRFGYARIHGVRPDQSSLRELVARFSGTDPAIQRPMVIEEEVAPGSEAPHSCAGPEPHVDRPYLDSMPRYLLQLCTRDSLAGSDLVLVDGMNAAQTLAMEQPMMAAELSRWPMLFSREGTDFSYQALMPILETGADGSFRRITFNDRASVDFMCPDDRLQACSEGFDHLARILEREGLQHRFRVQPGDLVIIDNHRVLHGRTASSAPGERTLLVGHLERAAVLSTWRRARSGNLD